MTSENEKVSRRDWLKFVGGTVVGLVVGGVLGYFGGAAKPAEKTVTVEKTKTIVSTVTSVSPTTITTTTAPPPTPTTVRIFRPGTVEKVRKWMEDAVKEFEKKYPNINVEPVYCGWGEYSTKIRSLVASGQAPDVAMIWIGDVYYYADQDALIPLDQYFDVEELKKSYPTLNACFWKGTLYGIPASVGNFVFFYHKKVFEKAGLDPEKPPRTWDEMVDYARQIQENTDSYGIGIPGDAITAKDVFTIHWYTLTKVKPEYDPETKTVYWDSSEGRKVLKFLYDLVNTWKVTQPDPLSYSRFDLRPLFRDGKIAMHFDGPWILPMLKEAFDFSDPEKCPIGITRIPSVDEKSYPYSASQSGCDQWVIFKQTKDLDAALELLKFVTSPEWQYKHDVIYGQIPARVEEYEEQEFKQWYYEPFKEMLKNSGPPQPVMIEMTEYQRLMCEMLQKIYACEMEIEDAIKAYAEKIKKLR